MPGGWKASCVARERIPGRDGGSEATSLASRIRLSEAGGSFSRGGLSHLRSSLASFTAGISRPYSTFASTVARVPPRPTVAIARKSPGAAWVEMALTHRIRSIDCVSRLTSSHIITEALREDALRYDGRRRRGRRRMRGRTYRNQRIPSKMPERSNERLRKNSLRRVEGW